MERDVTEVDGVKILARVAGGERSADLGRRWELPLPDRCFFVGEELPLVKLNPRLLDRDRDLLSRVSPSPFCSLLRPRRLVVSDMPALGALWGVALSLRSF